jgi:hypothetical protein
MKKIFLLSVLVLLQISVFAAGPHYFIGGGSSTAWNASPTTNWSATSGGSVRIAAPASGDYVIFDGAGGGNSACVITSSATCDSIQFTSGFTSSVTINASQKLTVQGDFTDKAAHSWTVTSTDAAALTISAASHINSGGLTFPGKVTFTGTNIKTLYANWTISGGLTISGTTTLNWLTNETLSCAGLLGTFNCSGTATIILTGGTWGNLGVISNNLTINGNVTIGSNVGYKTGILTYSSGTVTTTSSTLSITPPCTLNTDAGGGNKISWNNITISNASNTITINSLLTITNTLSLSNNVTFAGTSGFITVTLTDLSSSAQTITLANGITYTITSAFNAYNTSFGSILLFTSDHATNKAILTLQNGATCNVLASFTRIDASAGRTIWTFNGTATTCLNINAFNDLKTVSKSFVQ